jgi:predicted lipid-binding transport protein (Tim44 family)
MKKTVALMAVVLAVGMTAALDAEAKRLGGGRSGGMQRNAVTAPAPTPGPTGASALPGKAAPAAGTTAAAAAPGAAAAAGKRSWMGPIAGLAAGLGIAALASHFGFGEALANMLTIALVAMGVLMLVGFLMRKRAAAQAGALAGAGGVGAMRRGAQDVAYREQPVQRTGGSMIGSRIGGGGGTPWAPASAGVTGSVGTIPADFDTTGFERTARDQFIALQAANDARDLNRLRDYLSPEMFELVRSEIAERGDAPQKTEVFGLSAQVLDVADEADQYVVSVRFTGSVREQFGADTEDLNEVWHLVKPKRGFGGWVIAGIQQA